MGTGMLISLASAKASLMYACLRMALCFCSAEDASGAQAKGAFRCSYGVATGFRSLSAIDHSSAQCLVEESTYLLTIRHT